MIHRARELSVSNGAKLSLVHIVEPMAMAFGGDVPMDLSQLQQQQFDQAKERLERLKTKYAELEGANCHLTYGQPRQEIHHFAKEQPLRPDRGRQPWPSRSGAVARLHGQ